MEKLAEGVQDAVQDVHDGVRDVQAVCDWLNQVRMLDELINAKLAEREQLWSLATKITPEMSGMPHGGGVTDKVGNVVGRLVDLAKETDDLVDRYVDQKAVVIAALEKLPAKEYGVLHRHYIQYKSWEDIATDMGYCRMQIWRIHQSGLKMLQDVVEGYTIPVV